MSTQNHMNHPPLVRSWLLRGVLAAGLLLVVGSASGAVRPATQAGPATLLVSEGLDTSGQVRMTVNRSVVLTTVRPYKRVSVAQPEIADVNVLGPSSLLLTAKKGGMTQLIIWDDQERSQVVDVTIAIDVPGLQDQLRILVPAAKIEVSSANGAIVLRGRVPNVATAEQAVKLAEPFGKVLNFMEIAGGQQVMLQVRFAEVSRSATSALGVNLGFSDGRSFGGSNIGQVSPLGIKEFESEAIGLAVTSPNPSVSLFGKGRVGQTEFAYFVAALRQNNLLRILAEPNLIAISGQEASFLAGGEFPIPVSQGGGTGSGGAAVTVEYREFGVRLTFVPVVLGDGRVRLKVAPEVSDLDFTTAVRFSGFVVPGLTSRKVATTIELHEGQTFAIAGLLNNNVSATKDVTPVLGDLPVLGALFRSVRYQRKETELVVLVTPRLVEPLNPGQVTPLPGEKWRHPSEADLFLNSDIGGPQADTSRRPTTQSSKGPAPRYYGSHGFVAPAARSASASAE